MERKIVSEEFREVLEIERGNEVVGLDYLFIFIWLDTGLVLPDRAASPGFLWVLG